MTHETPDTFTLLERSVRQREQVVATYNGRRREFCPHALGIKRGKRHVLGYQFAGELGETRAEGWRCMDIDKLEDVTTRPGPWHSAPNIYNPQSCMDDVQLVVQVFPAVAQIDDAAASP
jgi:hypothetical protein